MPQDKLETFDIAKLDPEKDQFSNNVEQNYIYDLRDKKAGDFDVFTWNLFVILQKLNLQKGLKGPMVWINANKEARKMVSDLESIKIDVPVESERFEGLSVLAALKDLSASKRIKKLILTPRLDLLVIGENGQILYQFNLIAVKRDGAIELSKKNRESSFADDLEKWITTIVDEGGKFFGKYFGYLGDKKFEELKSPVISESRPNQTVSGVSGLRAGRWAPKIIDAKLRHLDLCSSYVNENFQYVLRELLKNWWKKCLTC